MRALSGSRRSPIKYISILILISSAGLGAVLAVMGSLGLAFLVWTALALATQAPELINGWKRLTAGFDKRKSLALLTIHTLPVAVSKS